MFKNDDTKLNNDQVYVFTIIIINIQVMEIDQENG